jgi:hypothetical protein
VDGSLDMYRVRSAENAYPAFLDARAA